MIRERKESVVIKIPESTSRSCTDTKDVIRVEAYESKHLVGAFETVNPTTIIDKVRELPFEGRELEVYVFPVSQDADHHYGNDEKDRERSAHEEVIASTAACLADTLPEQEVISERGDDTK